MPSESSELHATGPGQVPGPSRRSVLRQAAGAGVAGLAASTLVGASAIPALAKAARPASRPRADQADQAEPTTADGHPAGDVVVHLRDVRSGEMDIFAGTRHTRMRDPELAARLVRQIG